MPPFWETEPLPLAQQQKRLPSSALPFPFVVVVVAALASRPFEDCFLKHFERDSFSHFEEQQEISRREPSSSLVSREYSAPMGTALTAE